MKALALGVLLLCSVTAWSQPNPADYPITVHVVSSRVIFALGTKNADSTERLDVLIDGKKCELDGDPPKVSVLRWGVISPGDYKAKLTEDRHKGDYLRQRQYEILFPDGSTKKFYLVGESE
jgi:hypothetical protein